MRAPRPGGSPTGSATSAVPSPVTPGSSSTAHPGGDEFTIPDCTDPRAITSYALGRLSVIIAAYHAFLDKSAGTRRRGASRSWSSRSPPRPIAGPTPRLPWPGNEPQHDDAKQAMAMAGDDGCAARRASLTSPPAGEQAADISAVC